MEGEKQYKNLPISYFNESLFIQKSEGTEEKKAKIFDQLFGSTKIN